MARSSLQLVLDQKTPLSLSDANPKNGRQLLRKVVRHLNGILGGVVDASHLTMQIDGAQPVAAAGSVTCAAVAVADTFSINGQALTATEKRANCTVTVGTSVDEGDTVTVNGLELTATATPTLITHFLITGVAATDAAALVACINAQTSPLVSGIIEAVRPAANGVVNIYAIATGTAGNSYTIATSDAVDLAITNDSSGFFAGGAAAANNAFDPMGNNVRTATELALCINSSTTAIVSKHVEASNWAGVIALSGCAAGTRITIAGHEFTAIAAANSTSQGNPSSFSISGSNTQDGDALVAVINAHPVLSHQVVASNSSGTVTIRQRRGTSALGLIQCMPLGSNTVTQFAATAVVLVSALHEGQSGNAVTTASSSGTTLAITGSLARLAGGTGAASGTTVRMVVGGSAN